jgi:hypothetical protein
MNGYEALAYLSKSPDNKVYRDSWIDGTKYVSMTREGKIIFDGGLISTGQAVFGTLTGKGALEEGWHVYEETYTLSQAIDKVIEGKGRFRAHHKKEDETIRYSSSGWVELSCEMFQPEEQVGWTLVDTTGVG